MKNNFLKVVFSRKGKLNIHRRKIRLVNAMSSSKKIYLQRVCGRCFICLRTPPLLGFCLGRSSNFVSGQKQSVKLLQNTVSNTTQHPPHPSQQHNVCTLIQEKGWSGGGELERRLEGQQFTKLGPTNMTDCISILYSNKHLLQSPFTGQLF